jgi:hypothetical protein
MVLLGGVKRSLLLCQKCILGKIPSLENQKLLQVVGGEI